MGKLEESSGEKKLPIILLMSECMENMENGLPDAVAEDIKQHLDGLVEEFKQYFPGIDNETNENKLTRDPFCREVDDVPEAWQEEFLDLKKDFAARDASCSKRSADAGPILLYVPV